MIEYVPCYMCNRISTSREHVPPRCFFPEGYREQLITVPSCDIHNLQKSRDDEYLRFVISTSLTSGNVARDHVYPKVKRSFEKAPNKKAFLKNPKPITIGGIPTGTFDLDINRFNNCLDQIARGLYFSFFGYSWIEEITIIPPASSIIGPTLTDASEYEARAKIEIVSRKVFNEIEKIGMNQQIFYYQKYIDVIGNLNIRMVFYEGFSVIAFFGEITSLVFPSTS